MRDGGEERSRPGTSVAGFPVPPRALETAERLLGAGAAEAFFERVLATVPGHILVLECQDAQLRILFANAAAARDFGYSADELLQRDFFSLLQPGVSLPPQLDLVRKGLAADAQLRAELAARRRDGSRFLMGVTFAPMGPASDVPQRILCSGRDITAADEERRKHREVQEQLYAEMRERERIAIELRLAQKLESVGRLAAGIAHEINTPIQFVGDSVHFLGSAFADLKQLLSAYEAAIEALIAAQPAELVRARLRESEESLGREFLEQEIPAAFERSHEGIERVAAIVRAMREFAHSGTQEHSPGDINHAIETTLLVARNEYKYCASVETRLAELPPVLCNLNELNQVFLNLIVNAAHAIHDANRDAGAGRILISTQVVGQSVEIVVEDNGCGIPQENLERIFDPFFTTKEVGKGTGQGLAITRSIIVEKHAGSIAVDSEPGRGTRIILRIPIAGRSRGAA